jgi:hypothetical protein
MVKRRRDSYYWMTDEERRSLRVPALLAVGGALLGVLGLKLTTEREGWVLYGAGAIVLLVGSAWFLVLFGQAWWRRRSGRLDPPG